MKRAAAVVLIFVAGCHANQAPRSDTPGDKLEAAAVAAGLVSDPAHADPVGVYAREGDRVCMTRADRSYRIGALASYDEKNGCAAGGTARRTGDRLDVNLGGCRFEARFEGDRIVFPATLPAACDRYCIGRATLGALDVERLSGSAAEAGALRGGDGTLLCG